jgi:hypothetical protein
VRVLVTGSRDWHDRLRVNEELADILFEAPEGETITVIHGGCPSGADKIASEFTQAAGWQEKVYLPNWSEHGRKAGPIRNKQMVQDGFDYCLAFILNDSKGASGCLDMAKDSRKEFPGRKIREVRYYE